MTKNKNLFKNISLFLCLVPMLLLSLFCLVPKNKMDVSANYTYTSATFNSSNLILTRLGYCDSYTEFDFKDLSADWLDTLYYNFSFKIDYDSSTDNVIYYVKANFNDKNYLFDYTTGVNEPYTFCNIGNYNFISNTVSNIPVRVRAYVQSSNKSYYYSSPILFNLEYYDKDLNSYIVPNSSFLIRPSLVINEIIFGNYTDFDRMRFASDSLYGTHLNSGYYNFVSLIDNLGFRYTFFIPLCTASSESIDNSPANYLTYREYFTKNAINLSDNSAYQQGYSDGYNIGVGDGNGQGYQDGYNAGVDVGYGNGYNAGIEQSNNYSFLSLIGAVIDAPISAFTSLLNFNLLGFNMLGFVTGLITLCLIIFIIKLILGGK